MTQVSFYILASESSHERYIFACKLLEKAYRSGSDVYVMTENEAQSRMFDNLLWTFRAGSFIPHQIYTGEPISSNTAILISSILPPNDWQNIVMNLSSHHLDNPENFSRILEILDNTEVNKQAGRQRYSQYKQAGLELSSHKI